MQVILQLYPTYFAHEHLQKNPRCFTALDRCTIFGGNNLNSLSEQAHLHFSLVIYLSEKTAFA